LGVLLRSTCPCYESRRIGGNLGRFGCIDGGGWRCAFERTHTVVHLSIDCRDFVLRGRTRTHGVLIAKIKIFMHGIEITMQIWQSLFLWQNWNNVCYLTSVPLYGIIKQ